jgi:Kazal-type serine protease inhibitor domain
MLTRSLFLASIFAVALPACGGQTDSAPGGDDEAKADLTSGGGAYYLIRSDAKGNSFVKRVNFATTTCADGTSSAECAVAAVDYSLANLDETDMSAVAGRPMIVRGSLSSTGLAAKEVWIAAAGSAGNGYAPVSAMLYRVKDNGVRCVAAPCPSDRETKLNGTTARDIAGIDLSSVGASDEQINAAYVAMTGDDGAFVDGTNAPVSGKGGSYLQLVAANFYVRLAHGTTGQSCGSIAGITCGASQWCDPTPNDACGAADLMGSCKDTNVLCSQLWQPVCGCDGKTYSNDCTRLVHQVQLAHAGACAN